MLATPAPSSGFPVVTTIQNGKSDGVAEAFKTYSALSGRTSPAYASV